jgi:hypothetical protein
MDAVWDRVNLLLKARCDSMPAVASQKAKNKLLKAEKGRAEASAAVLVAIACAAQAAGYSQASAVQQLNGRLEKMARRHVKLAKRAQLREQQQQQQQQSPGPAGGSGGRKRGRQAAASASGGDIWGQLRLQQQPGVKKLKFADISAAHTAARKQGALKGQQRQQQQQQQGSKSPRGRKQQQQQGGKSPGGKKRRQQQQQQQGAPGSSGKKRRRGGDGGGGGGKGWGHAD